MHILGCNKTFWDRQSSTSLPDCVTTLPLFVFTWWEDFLKISWKCVGWEVEGLSFRLNGWQQYCARNYEKKCKLHFMLILATWSQTSSSCFPLFDVDLLEIANCSDLTIVFYPLGNFGKALCIRSCHEDLILIRKSHNWLGLHLFRENLQVAQSWLNRLYDTEG